MVWRPFLHQQQTGAVPGSSFHHRRWPGLGPYVHPLSLCPDRPELGSAGHGWGAPTHMPTPAIGAPVRLESGPRFGAEFLGDAERLAAARVPDLGLTVPSPVRRVQGQLSVDWSSAGHSPSLARRSPRDAPLGFEPAHGTRNARDSQASPLQVTPVERGDGKERGTSQTRKRVFQGPEHMVRCLLYTSEPRR